MDDITFADRLKRLRAEHGYSYKKLEELTGISRSSLQRYENGLKTNLSTSKIAIIADAYNVPPTYLLGWESKDMPYENFKSITPLLKEIGYEIVYHGSTESFTLNDGSISHPITIEQIKDLKDTTLSYVKFKLYDNILKPPTTE